MVQWRCSTSLFQSEKKLAGVYKYLTVNIEKWGKTWRQRTLHPCGKMHLETIDHFHGPIKLLSASHEEFGGYPGKLQSPCASEHPRFAMHNLVKHTTDIKPRTATCQMPLPEKEGKSSYFCKSTQQGKMSKLPPESSICETLNQKNKISSM